MHVLEDSGDPRISSDGLISHYPDRWYIIPIALLAASVLQATAGWPPLFGKNSRAGGNQKGPREGKVKRRREGGEREREQEKRQSRALVWGSRRLIHVSKWDRRSPRPPILFLPFLQLRSVMQDAARLLIASDTAPPLPRISRTTFSTPILNSHMNLHIGLLI